MSCTEISSQTTCSATWWETSKSQILERASSSHWKTSRERPNKSAHQTGSRQRLQKENSTRKRSMCGLSGVLLTSLPLASHPILARRITPWHMPLSTMMWIALTPKSGQVRSRTSSTSAWPVRRSNAGLSTSFLVTNSWPPWASSKRTKTNADKRGSTIWRSSKTRPTTNEPASSNSWHLVMQSIVHLHQDLYCFRDSKLHVQ